MSITGEADLKGLRRVGRFVSTVLHKMKAHLRPGMSTAELDYYAGRLFNEAGARSAPKVSYDFPGNTCISLNHDVAHGIPREDLIIRPGDLINIDVSAELDGYFADTGHSFQVPPVTAEVQKLCLSTARVMNRTISALKTGTKLNEIGRTIADEAGRLGYTTIKNLCSHGVGRALHEEPHNIYNFYDSSQQGALANGVVITIEPFLSTYDEYVVETGDGWTLTTPNRSQVAQHEHTLVVTPKGPIVMTFFE